MQDVLSLVRPSPEALYTSSLVFFRITGFFIPLPFFGSQQIPTRIKMILITAITILIVTHVPKLVMPPPILSMLIYCAKEMGLGLAMGFVFMGIMQVILMAGEMVSVQMGLSFATLVDPETNINSPIVGQFFNVMMLLLFLSINAHLALLKLLDQSITFMPLGHFAFSDHIFQNAFDLMSFMMTAALLLALPVMLMLLMINLATGMMSKAASQLNIFSIGLPVSLLAGILTLAVTSPSWGDNILKLLDMGLYKVAQVMG